MRGNSLLFLLVATAFFTATFGAWRSGGDTDSDSGRPVFVAEALASSTPAERNRIWKLFNNSCHAPPDMTPAPTAFETNICLLVHKRSTRANRKRALLTLRRIKAIQFYDVQTDMLVVALERRRPDFFIAATKLVIAPTPGGRFISELISDRERVVLIMAGKRVPLEE